MREAAGGHDVTVQEHTRPPRSRSSSLGLALLAVLLLGVPIARGGVDVPVVTAVVLLAGAAALLATWATAEVPASALALGVVVAIILLQLVPLPPALHALSPATQAVFETSLGELGVYPRARPLTLDIPATGAELGKAVACLAVFVAAGVWRGILRAPLSPPYLAVASKLADRP